MKRRGFTLLEVLVATSIMGIAVAALLSTLTTSVGNATRVAEADRAAMLARTQMNALLTDPRLPHLIPVEQPFDPSLLGGAKGGWRARVMPFEVPVGAAPGSPILERIELEVWWMNGESRRTYSLEGYRRGTLLPGDTGL
ncbi:MAG: type II secretion system protein [Bryobacterales bacterium]|nr:type II secretion system protein [Bryobacterales bacterium]